MERCFEVRGKRGSEEVRGCYMQPFECELYKI